MAGRDESSSCDGPFAQTTSIRENDARDGDRREDGPERVYDDRDRDDHNPRDGLPRDLDLPRGEERELVVGAFRVVREHDLDLHHDTVEHLRDEGPVDTVDLGDGERGLTLTEP